jgi:serine/threonine protein kinase/Tfp pilus assembly protein PilF
MAHTDDKTHPENAIPKGTDAASSQTGPVSQPSVRKSDETSQPPDVNVDPGQAPQLSRQMLADETIDERSTDLPHAPEDDPSMGPAHPSSESGDLDATQVIPPNADDRAQQFAGESPDAFEPTLMIRAGAAGTVDGMESVAPDPIDDATLAEDDQQESVPDATIPLDSSGATGSADEAVFGEATLVDDRLQEDAPEATVMMTPQSLGTSDGADPAVSDEAGLEADGTHGSSREVSTDESDASSQADSSQPGEITLAENASGEEESGTAKRRSSQSSSRTSVRVDASDDHSIERYHFIEEIGRGGMGRIMRAEDSQLHREVACKILLKTDRAGTTIRERFVEEAQITGQLEHPGVVPVHEVGKDSDGNPYYTMKLIHGTSLKQVIREFHEQPLNSSSRRLLFARLLQRFVDVCNTVAFAHQRGVLHRDLKPDNVMLGDFGETLVVDWGLAKVVGSKLTGEQEDDQSSLHVTPLHTLFGRDDDTHSLSAGLSTRDSISTTGSVHDGSHSGGSHAVQTDARTRGTDTMAGELLGTLKYMSPEQSQGRHAELDVRSDVYSLGAILYDILTGKRAMKDQRKLAIALKAIRKGEIKSAREIAPWIPRSLDAVCMTALATDREDRYASALLLGSDIEAWLADEPVSVYQESWTERARRWARTRRSLVAGTMTAVVVLVAGSIVWSQVHAHGLARLEEDVRQAIVSAETAAAEGRLDEARELLVQADSMVRTQPQLVDLSASITERQRYVDQLAASAESQRVEDKRRLAEVDLLSARTLIDSGDAVAARDVLIRVEAELAGESKLKSTADEVAELLQQVTSTLTIEQEKSDASQQLEQFHKLADLARQHASLFTGEQIVDDIRKAQQNAQDAVAIYSLGKPWQSQPPHLSPEELQSVRVTGFELLLLLAEVELAEASLTTPPGSEPQTPDANAPHVEAALQSIEAAHSLGFQTRTLELRRAECLDQLGRDNARDVALSAAEQLQPSTRLDYFLLAEYERKAGRLDNAVAAYRQALRRDADDFWSMHFLGICLYQQKEAVGAVSHLTACVAYRPDFVWSYLARALAFAELDDFDSAYADLAVAEQLEPDLYAIGVNRGGLLLKQNRLKEAVEQFERSAQLDDSRYEPWLNLGIARREMAVAASTRGAPPEETSAIYRAAAQALEQAVQRGGGSRVFRVLGDVLRRTGSAQLALQQYSLAASQERDPKLQADDVRQAGSIFLAAERLEEALKQYRMALDLDPDNGDLQRLYAETLIRAGQFQDAIVPLTRALELSGPNADVYRARGSVLARLGRYREAMDDYTLSLELEADAPNILSRRGWAYILHGNDLALSDFRRAVELNPESADSHNGLGYALVLAGKVDEAVVSARTAVRKAEPQLAAQGSIAWPLLYNAATVLAQASARASETDAEKYSTEAVELLRRVIGIAGEVLEPVVRGNIGTDKALDPIRTREAFKKAFPADDETR